MDVTNRKSAIERVTGVMSPRPIVKIVLRRKPRFDVSTLTALLAQVPQVKAVRQNAEGGFWIDPTPGIDQEGMEKLVSDFVKLADVIV